uniref:CSP3 n=1 Tax=Episyrphus balteatus TaxID=286459 RepID=A0A6H0D2X0_EPIBA|nr:CSP3 [Episyrphus balteatus]
MQAIAIACSVLFVIVDFTQAQDDISNSLYTTRYERLDIDTILASPRLVTNYVECLLNKKPCAPEGKALKRILPEALRTKCGRCHPSQKEVALKVITALYFDYPQYYKALQERWDPSGDYNKRFEEYLRDQKFNSIGGGDSENGEQAQVNPPQVHKKLNRNKIKTTASSSTSTTRQPFTYSNQPLSLRLISFPDNGSLLLRPLSRILANIPFFG